MKIAIIGGGSTYTPEGIEGLLARGKNLGLQEIVLMDIDCAGIISLCDLLGFFNEFRYRAANGCRYNCKYDGKRSDEKNRSQRNSRFALVMENQIRPNR